MTTQPKSQCAACVHFRSAFSVTPFADDSFCEAFPDGIPQERALGSIALLNRYGPAFVPRLMQESFL